MLTATMAAIGRQSSFTVGRSHGPQSGLYHARIDAVHYAMANDDGASGSEYQKADVILISDTTMISIDTPSITSGLRGLSYMQVEVEGPNRDLHSGLYGGAVVNPCNVLCEMIASLKDKSGHITIPGFYDGVADLPKATKKQWQSLKFSDAKFLKEVGLSVPAGEKGKSVLEQVWARPTAEVNGIWGGYTGAGTKTVSMAIANASGFSLAGGGDTIAAIQKYDIYDKVSYISTAGGAFLEYLEGKVLPAVAILEERAKG